MPVSLALAGTAIIFHGGLLHHRLTEQLIAPWNHWFQQGSRNWHHQDDAVSADFLRGPGLEFQLLITSIRNQVNGLPAASW
ncbi:hypothetical protein WDV93_14550 [Pantoea ananatis]